VVCMTANVLKITLTTITGYGDRLLNEVKRLALKDVKIKIYAPPERKYSTWIGGSILAGLNAFKKVVATLFSLVDPMSDHHTDVGVCRRISGGPRYHPQEVQLLTNDWAGALLVCSVYPPVDRIIVGIWAWFREAMEHESMCIG
jgi:hypothetical protein